MTSDVEPTPPTADDKLWAMLAHLSYFVVGILGPLVIWLVKKDTSTFVGDQAKEALNFQLAVTIVATVLMMTIVLIPLAMIVVLGGMVFSILAVVETNNGKLYRYPYTLRLVR